MVCECVTSFIILARLLFDCISILGALRDDIFAVRWTRDINFDVELKIVNFRQKALEDNFPFDLIHFVPLW